MKKIAITQRIIENSDYYEVRDCLDVKWSMLFKEYFDAFDIDGVILTGGNDLASVSESEVNSKRDEFEKELLKYCIERDIPVFDVCRGMQVIGEYFRGRLEKVEGHISSEHEIMVEDGFRNVNSYHNYGFKELPDDFVAKAKAKDGVIEAFKHRDYKVFGQMWHPERENSFDEDDLESIRKFFLI